MSTTDVFMDFSCPWCYIAHRRLAGAESSVRTWRTRAFQLNPDISADGLARTTYRVNKFGSLTESQRRDARVVGAAKRVGLDIDFDIIEVTPNTRNAHRAMKAVEARAGDPVAFAEAVFAAYFVGGRDIGSAEELVAIAEQCGLDVRSADLEPGTVFDDQVSRDIEAARAAGLTGVPFLVSNTDSGPQPISLEAAMA